MRYASIRYANIFIILRAVEVLERNSSNSDQTGFARYKELLKFPGSIQATYGYRASYSQSDQILQTAAENRLIIVSFNKRFKCVENSHFSTTDYCTVKLAPAAKLIQYYL